ncbi:hypothetical protein AURDEDRAFT_174662 [Auricularia subglabra TFB-10046 SS5]|uniref:F-box domain-containing protein n=1 Tax=Auricularia subglabra (strain TFB-10046 / SS5) TaxID=717982 RepID=J0CYA5_AURST|nr:hypothetical protein AURDEDRAFT_174662 [Auricularia subglabra TFB-10046 SS5]
MSASHVPPELWLEIFAAGLSSVDLAHVRCVCRPFCDIAESILYTTVSLASTHQMRGFTLALLSKPRLGELTRSLTLDWFRDIVEESVQDPDVEFWQFHKQSVFADGTPDINESNETTAAIDQEARRRNMTRPFCNAIREQVPSAHAVLLLDMLPRLRTLRVIPSAVEFWLWASFPDPCNPDVAKRLPQGLLSLESLDIRYKPDYDGSELSEANGGVGFAHIKVISALLLPNLRRLSFSGDYGEATLWGLYTEDTGGKNHSRLDMTRLQKHSSVSQIKLRGLELETKVVLSILGMLAAPEIVQVETQDEADFAPYDAFLACPTLRSFKFIEYPGDYFPRPRNWQPLVTLSTRDHLTHIALPVLALAVYEDDNLAQKIPRGVEHLDLAYTTASILRGDVDRLVKLVHDLAANGSRVRRLTVRPAQRDARLHQLRVACAASGVLFCERPCIEVPAGLCDPPEDWDDVYSTDGSDMVEDESDYDGSEPYSDGDEDDDEEEDEEEDEYESEGNDNDTDEA